MPLKGQTALITGGTRGIGRAIAGELARMGANVAIGSRNLADAQEVAAAIAAIGVKAKGYGMDVSSASDVEAAFGAIKADFERLDILVNNAGITKDGLLIRMAPEDWDAVINVNLKSVFLCSREAVKMMSRQRYGRIINISSVVAFTGNPGQVNYSASKAGMVGLTKTIAKEYASRGITVNAVAPGFIETAMTDKLSGDVKKQMLAAIPANKFGTVADVAAAVSFLCSPGAGYITGHVIHVNGGMYM